ncbi:MAG: GNAT family N-acetyltransferase [Pseudomonadota bacterium]
MTAKAALAVHRLWPRHAAAIARHLLRLDPEDRRLRFGRAMRDEAIDAYVSGIDFTRDRAFGIFGDGFELAGVAHLAMDDATGQAELGLSVDAVLRGHGYGTALLRRAVLHATNRGYRALLMHCLAENAAMLHLARKAGLRTVVRAGEADAHLALDRALHGGAIREAMEDQFALVDYLLRQQHAWLVNRGPQRARPAQTAGNRSSTS